MIMKLSFQQSCTLTILSPPHQDWLNSKLFLSFKKQNNHCYWTTADQMHHILHFCFRPVCKSSYCLNKPSSDSWWEFWFCFIKKTLIGFLQGPRSACFSCADDMCFQYSFTAGDRGQPWPACDGLPLTPHPSKLCLVELSGSAGD